VFPRGLRLPGSEVRTAKTYIQTWSGRQFWPLDPRPEEVFLEDIAWMLAQQTRWKGATKMPYSIAQHSVMVSRLCDPEFALQGLLHDATEAYLGDMAGPIKSGLPDFVRAENRLWEAIATRFGVEIPLHSSVKHADLVMLHTESRDLMLPPPVEWRDYLPPPMEDCIAVWGPVSSANAFLHRFDELTRFQI
jgi:hypothetical protein